MAVEVFNLQAYMVQASIVDPDLAVRVDNATLYSIDGVSAERVSAKYTVMHTINGTQADTITIPTMKAYAVTGGQRSDGRVVVGDFSVYIIQAPYFTAYPYDKPFVMHTNMHIITE